MPRAVTAAKPTAGGSANLIMPWERAYDFDALHPVAISNAGEDQSALLNQLRERALASVDDPNTTLAIFESSAETWLRRGRLGRDSSGHAGARLHGIARSDFVVAGDGPAPVFRTEVMCQNVPSLDEPVSPLAWSSYADPGPDHQRRRAPSLIMSRKPVRLECVTQCRGFDSLEPPGKSNRLRSATGWT